MQMGVLQGRELHQIGLSCTGWMGGFITCGMTFIRRCTHEAVYSGLAGGHMHGFLTPDDVAPPPIRFPSSVGSRSGIAFTRTQSSDHRSTENLAALDLPEFGWRSATDMRREDEAKSEKVCPSCPQHASSILRTDYNPFCAPPIPADSPNKGTVPGPDPPPWRVPLLAKAGEPNEEEAVHDRHQQMVSSQCPEARIR